MASIRNGEWYQDLYGWSRILDLSPNCRLERVRLEANDAAHVDDVVAHSRDPKKPIEFVQLKFHVGTEAGRYSTEYFVAPPRTAASAARAGRKSLAQTLLQKFWSSWLQLRDEPRGVLLILHSNWSWEDGDPLRPLISGVDDRLPDSYFIAAQSSDVGRARERWREHLKAEPDEFERFMRAMRFQLGQGSTQRLRDAVADRMADRCLYADDEAVDRAVGRVGKWIREKVDTISPALYEAALDELRLKLPDADPAVRVCLHTIERQQYREAADHVVDWCEHFLPSTEGQAYPRGHTVHDALAWNGVFLPELHALKAHLNTASIRLLRVRGQARLSAWIAFGHVFDGRARYVIEVDQGGGAWRSDTAPASGIDAVAPDGILELAAGPDVAIGVSVTNRVGPAVRDAIGALALPVDALLVLEPSTGIGRHAIASAAQLSAFVEGVRQRVSELVAARRAKRVHLFYSGPFSGAVFLGHALGAAAPEIQLYEDQQPGYAPSFLLRA